MGFVRDEVASWIALETIEVTRDIKRHLRYLNNIWFIRLAKVPSTMARRPSFTRMCRNLNKISASNE
eukprot:5866276-Amphidinium_carterae.1